jgi:uncharacterized LabA/DUF88 family protein
VGKNVAVFVDVANIFYAAKAAGVDIDYVTLLKAASAGRDLVRAYAYTGLDPDNENQRNFHDFLRRSNYKVVSKDIRKYGDGKVKANLDIELVVDMMKTARNLDIAIVVSGDGDFAPAIRAVQEQGVRVEVISFRGNTSSDLIEVADLFTDIVQLAKVEKGSRSGRRVADDDADLSMTEVPDKQTEGTGVGRGRGRGRGRGKDAEPIAATSRSRTRTRSTGVAAAAAVGAEPTGLVALPGERLSRGIGSLTEADLAKAEVFTLDEDAEAIDQAGPNGREPSMEGDGDEPRRRRRRGGRGRGRGRGRAEDGMTADELDPKPSEPVARGADTRGADTRGIDTDDGPRRDDDIDDIDDVPAPRGPRTTPFGSVWDSQLGTPTATTASTAPIDDDDFDEPEIPEYLIAEQRRGADRGRSGGARGGRSAYQSAMQRERYGRGGGGGINRYPDVSARSSAGGAPREDRSYSRSGPRPETTRPARDSNEPWSDVPPELEAMLRAQVSQKPATSPEPVDVPDTAEVKPKARATRKPATRSTTAKTPAKPRAPRKSTTTKATADASADLTDGAAATPKPRASRTTKPKATSAKAAGAGAEPASSDADSATPAKRRTTRKTTTAEPA